MQNCCVKKFAHLFSYFLHVHLQQDLLVKFEMCCIITVIIKQNLHIDINYFQLHGL